MVKRAWISAMLISVVGGLLFSVASVMVAQENGATIFLPAVIKQEPPTPTPLPTATQTPTLTPTDIPTPTPTPTPTDIPTPTPTPTIAPGVVVLSSNAFVPYSGSSSLYIIGEVLNNTGSNVRFTRINATLRDGAGNVVGSDYSYSSLDTLVPGMTSPFLVIFSDPQAWNSYDLVVTWQETDAVPYALEILNTNFHFDSFDAYHIVGEARNQYSEQRTFVKAVVTLYDAEGKVIGVDYTYTNPHDLNPGQTASFDVSVYFWKYKPDRSKVANHRLQVFED